MSFQPEIKDDELFYEIVAQVERVKPRTVIEIGSANGLGSTQAFIQGIQKSGAPCTLFCFEIDEERRRELLVNTATDNGSVVVMEGSAVPGYMSAERVKDFLRKFPNMNPAQYGEDTVLSWRAAIEKQMAGKPADGLDRLFAAVEGPTIALVDGSPFSGLEEAMWLYFHDIDVIILDDTQDIKCYDAYLFLKGKGYRLLQENPNLRNGYAIFERGEI